MHIKRLIAGTVTAGMLGLVPLAATAPAHATENRTVTVTLEQNYGSNIVVFGDEVSLIADLSDNTGSSPYATGDTVTLWRMEAGSRTWEAVETLDAGGYNPFTNVKPRKNTTYKVTYSGATATSIYDHNYAPAESATYAVKVRRKITSPSSGFVLTGKVSPKYKNKKIIVKVSKRQKKGYSHFRTIRTNKKSRYRIVLPKRRGTWYWQIIVPGNSQYAINGYGWRTTVY